MESSPEAGLRVEARGRVSILEARSAGKQAVDVGEAPKGAKLVRRSRLVHKYE